MAIRTVPRAPRRLNCPIEPETLLAQIQGELTIDELRLVQAHERECAQCQAMLEQLREAYAHVAALADVPEVPTAGLRESLLRESHGRLRAVRLARGLNIGGRGLLLIATGAVLTALLLTIAIVRPFLQSGAFTTQRSANALAKLAPVGNGVVYAQSVKLVPITVGNVVWDLGEVVVIDEQNGQIVRSLPTSNQSAFVPQLGGNAGVNLRPALSPDGKTLVQAAIIADGHSPTAFAAIDTATGAVRYVARLSLPAGVASQAVPTLRQIWIGRDNATIYVLTDLVINNQRDAHILSFALADGQQRPTVIPPLDAMGPVAGLGGFATVLAPDGTHAYDAQLAVDDKNRSGVLVAFIRLTDQQAEPPLFIPGNFRGLGLSITLDGKRLILFNGNTATVTFITTATRAVSGMVALVPGDQPQLTTENANDSIDVSQTVAADGQYLYIARDLVAGTKRTFTIWSVNLAKNTFGSVTKFDQPVGTIFLTSDGSHMILLRRNGILQSLDVRNLATPQPWVTLTNNTTILQVIGAFAPPSK